MKVRIVSADPPATERQVAALELKLGIELPSDYRSFLLEYNGGRPKIEAERFGDAAFDIWWDQQPWAADYAESLVHGFYSLDEKSTVSWSAAEAAYLTVPRVPEDFVPIAFDRGSNQILLGIRGERRGRVYFWAKDYEPQVPGYENVGFVANSFGEFLEGLHPLSGGLGQG